MPRPFSMTGTVEQLLTALEEFWQRNRFIRSQMQDTGSVTAWWWRGLAVCCLLFFIAIVIDHKPFIAISSVSVIVCLAVGSFWSSRQDRWTAQHMEIRRLALMRQFLTCIGRDISLKARCAVDISFDDYRTHGQLLSKRRAGFLWSALLFQYTDTWFTARGRLCDGNRFRIRIEQRIQGTETKEGGEDRRYTVIRENITEKVVLMLRISSASYPDYVRLAQMLQNGAFHGIDVTHVSMHDDRVRVVCKTMLTMRQVCEKSVSYIGEENLANGDTLLQLFLFVYTQLQSCRGDQGETMRIS